MDREQFVDELVRTLHKATGGVDSTIPSGDCGACRRRVEALLPVIATGVHDWIEVQGDDCSSIELAEMFVERFGRADGR